MFNVNNLTVAWDFFKLIFTELILLLIIVLFLKFFGLKATAIYFIFTFIFATLIGALLEKLGMEDQIKNDTNI